MGCFVRGGKNGMGCYVRGDKNGMGCSMHDFSSKPFRRTWQLVEYDCWSKKTAKSDTLSILFLSEVRHLVEKNRSSVGLCFFRNMYQNILPGIGNYKKSEWLTRLLGKLSSLVRVLPSFYRLLLVLFRSTFGSQIYSHSQQCCTGNGRKFARSTGNRG